MGKALQSTVAPLATLHSQVTFITPQLASQYLMSNTRNRSISKASVSAYAHDMINGRWLLNGDAIRFAQDGTLLDGQHRLQAIIEANVGVSMLVIHNLPAETFATIDAGASGRRVTFLGWKVSPATTSSPAPPAQPCSMPWARRALA